MDEREIIIRAFKAEARLKPLEKLIIGRKVYTYTQFVEILERKNTRKDDLRAAEEFVKTAIKMLQENPRFRQAMMKLAEG